MTENCLKTSHFWLSSLKQSSQFSDCSYLPKAVDRINLILSTKIRSDGPFLQVLPKALLLINCKESTIFYILNVLLNQLHPPFNKNFTDSRKMPHISSRRLSRFPFRIIVALEVNKIVTQAEFSKSINFRNIQIQDL